MKRVCAEEAAGGSLAEKNSARVRQHDRRARGSGYTADGGEALVPRFGGWIGAVKVAIEDDAMAVERERGVAAAEALSSTTRLRASGQARSPVSE
jgi:hypothetical protein